MAYVTWTIQGSTIKTEESEHCNNVQCPHDDYYGATFTRSDYLTDALVLVESVQFFATPAEEQIVARVHRRLKERYNAKVQFDVPEGARKPRLYV